MRIKEYFCLTLTVLKSTKRRLIIAAVISSLSLGIVMALYLLIAGAQNAIYNALNSPTGGEVLVATMPDVAFCQEECTDSSCSLEIKQNIQRYRGRVVEDAFFHKADTNGHISTQLDEITFEKIYPVLPADVMEDAIEYNLEQVPTPLMPILLPLDIAAAQVGVKFPEYTVEQHMSKDEFLREILEISNTIRETLLGSEITMLNGEHYFVVGFLPSNISKMPLSLASVNKSGNWLDIIFSGSPNVTGAPIVIAKDSIPQDFSIEKADVILSLFPTMQLVREYKEDIQNTCDLFNRGRGDCPDDYRYAVSWYFGGSLEPKLAPERVYDFLNPIVALVLTLSAAFFANRLSKAENQMTTSSVKATITKDQSLVVMLFCSFIMMFFVIISAIVVGSLLVILVNLIKMDAISQLFAIVFGLRYKTVWIIGQSKVLWLIILCYGLLIILMNTVLNYIRLRKNDIKTSK